MEGLVWKTNKLSLQDILEILEIILQITLYVLLGKENLQQKKQQNFVKKILERLGYDFVSNVFPLSSEDAHSFFDMENEDAFPIFE